MKTGLTTDHDGIFNIFRKAMVKGKSQQEAQKAKKIKPTNQVRNTMQDFNNLKVPELKKLANKELGLKYSKLDKMKKADIIQAFIDSQEEVTEAAQTPVDTAPVPTTLSPRESILQDVDSFLTSGGEITTLKPGAIPDRQAPTEQSAECNLNKKHKVTKSKLSADKKEKAPRKAKSAKSENLITLQDIIEELGITGIQARKKLRTSDIKKPGKQWAWEKTDPQVKEVKKLLKV